MNTDELAFVQTEDPPKQYKLRKPMVLRMGVSEREWIVMNRVFAEDDGKTCPWYSEYRKRYDG